jgi:selenoprotein W-related protein
VALVPGTGGVFQIAYEGEIIWDRTHDRGFPEAKILKQRVSDRLDPERSLGHSDR